MDLLGAKADKEMASTEEGLQHWDDLGTGSWRAKATFHPDRSSQRAPNGLNIPEIEHPRYLDVISHFWMGI